MIMQGTPKVTLNHNICNMEKKVACGIGFSITKNINKYLTVSVLSKSLNNYLTGINFNFYNMLLSPHLQRHMPLKKLKSCKISGVYKNMELPSSFFGHLAPAS